MKENDFALKGKKANDILQKLLLKIFMKMIPSH